MDQRKVTTRSLSKLLKKKEKKRKRKCSLSIFFPYGSFFFPIFRNWKGRMWGPWCPCLREAGWQQLPPRGHADIWVPGSLRAGGGAGDHVSTEQPVVWQQAQLCMWVLCLDVAVLSCDCQAGGEGGKEAGALRKGERGQCSEPLESASLIKKSMGVLKHQLPCFAHSGKTNPCYCSISYIKVAESSLLARTDHAYRSLLPSRASEVGGLRHSQAMGLRTLIMS